MRVIDERPGARRGETHVERLTGLDGGGDLAGLAAPAGHAVVVAFELETVPVNGSLLFELVDQGNDHRLAPGEDNGGAGIEGRVERRFRSRILRSEERRVG